MTEDSFTLKYSGGCSIKFEVTETIMMITTKTTGGIPTCLVSDMADASKLRHWLNKKLEDFL